LVSFFWGGFVFIQHFRKREVALIRQMTIEIKFEITIKKKSSMKILNTMFSVGQ